MKGKRYMKHHTFSVGNKPRVVVSRVKGNLTVHSWNERSIDIRVDGENDDDSTVQLYSEGDTVFIQDCRGSIELYVPYEKKQFASRSLTTDIRVTDLEGRVVMERVGNVDITNISGDIVLSHVEGNLRATNAPKLVEGQGIGGDATLENISLIEIGSIGAALSVTHAEVVKVGSVGSALRVQQIDAAFHCGSVGGSCEIRESTNASVLLSNVGGSLHLDRVARLSSCNVGGSLSMLVDIPSKDSTQLTVGGSATLRVLRDANVRMRIMAGGSISGEAVQQKCGNMATLTYGNGSASLNLTVGGSVKLDWATELAYPNSITPYNIAGEGPLTITQKREAILKMVEQGRITPDEGNALLDALGQ